MGKTLTSCALLLPEATASKDMASASTWYRRVRITNAPIGSFRHRLGVAGGLAQVTLRMHGQFYFAGIPLDLDC